MDDSFSQAAEEYDANNIQRLSFGHEINPDVNISNKPEKYFQIFNKNYVTFGEGNNSCFSYFRGFCMAK